MSASKIKSSLNLFVVMLMLFQQIAFPLQALAAELRSPTPPTEPAPIDWPVITPAQAEANLMYALTNLLNAPPEAEDMSQQALDVAVKIYEQALKQAENAPAEAAPAKLVEAPAPVAAPVDTPIEADTAEPVDAPAGIYQLNAFKKADDGALLSWEITGQPDNPAEFDRNLSEALNLTDTGAGDGSFTVTGPPTAPNAEPPARPLAACATEGVWSNGLEIYELADCSKSDSTKWDLFHDPQNVSNITSTGLRDNQMDGFVLGRHMRFIWYYDTNYGGTSYEYDGPDYRNYNDGTSTLWDKMSSFKLEWKPCDGPYGNQVILYDAPMFETACEALDYGDYANPGAYHFDSFADYEYLMPNPLGGDIYSWQGPRTHNFESLKVGNNAVAELYPQENFGGTVTRYFAGNYGTAGSNAQSIINAVVSNVDIGWEYTPPAEAIAGTEFDLEYRVTNIGLAGNTEPEPKVHIALPEGVEYTGEATPACSYVSGSTVACNLPSISSGGNTTGYLTLKPTADATPGTLTLDLSVNGVREKTADKGSTVSHNITIISQADLGITLSGPAAVTKNRTGVTTYTVQTNVTNYGTSPSTGAVVTVTAPANTTASNLTCGGATCDLGAMAVYSSTTSDFDIVVPFSVAEGSTLTTGANTANSSGSVDPDPDPHSNTATAVDTVLTYWNQSIGSAGPGGAVYDLRYQSGTLYAAGTFGVKTWSGTSWDSLGSLGTTYVLISDGGSGFYAGTDSGISRWNGSSWSSFAATTGGPVYALAIDDDGDLYAGGKFSRIGTLTTDNIARWDGASWYSLGVAGVTQGIGAFAAHVRAIVPHGDDIYVGGMFKTPANHIARWNKTEDVWSSLGEGISYSSPAGYAVMSMVELNGQLYIGGQFVSAGGQTANHIAAWDLNDESWLTLAGGMGDSTRMVRDLNVVNGQLIAGGNFATAGGVTVNHAAKWTGASWTSFGLGVSTNDVYAVTGGGSPTDIFVGGGFGSVDDGLVTANNVGRYLAEATDIRITSHTISNPATAGQPFVANFTVNNNGGSTAFNVAARYRLPANVTFSSAAGCTNDNGAVTCAIGDMTVGESRSFTVNGALANTARGSLTSQVWAGAYQLDSSGSDNFSTLSRAILSNAELAVTLSAPATATAGQSFNATVNVTNNGPAVAAASVLTLTVPVDDVDLTGVTGLTCVTASEDATHTILRCDLGDMASAGTANGTLTFDVPFDALGTVSLNAQAVSLIDDPTPANNTRSTNTTIQDVADLAVSLNAPSVVYQPSGGLAAYTYNVGVVNNGPSLARSAAITLNLPAAVTFDTASSGCSHQNGVVSCPAGDLDPNDSAQFTVDVDVNYGTPSGTGLDAYALTASSATDLNPTNNTKNADTTVSTSAGDNRADLQVTQTANTPVYAGETLVYWVNVFNAGAVESAFTLTDTMPSGAEFDPSLSDPACYESLSTPGLVACDFPALRSGGQRQVDIALTLPADAAAGTQLANTAQAVAAKTDMDPADNVSNFSVTVQTQADLRLTMDASHTTVSAGDRVTYTLTVKNLGPSLARSVSVSNPQPTGMVLQSISASQGSCSGTSCNLGNLDVKQSATVQVIFTAGSGTPTNQATVSSSTPDSDNSNNTVSALLEIAGAERTTRTFGAADITADVFIDTAGGVQAFGDVWLGDHLHLAGATDSMVINEGGGTFTGQGTLEYLQEGIQLFTGDFTGTFNSGSATVIPAAGVQYHFDELAGFSLADINFSGINLLNGRASGQTTGAQVHAPGFDRVLIADIWVEPGPTYGGTVSAPFNFDVAGINFAVTTAEFFTGGLRAATVDMTLPEAWGSHTGTVNDLVITEDGVSIGGASVSIVLPDIQISGQTVQMIDNSITIIFNGQDLMFIGDGTLDLHLPDNQTQSHITFSIDPSGNFVGTVDQLRLNLASSWLDLTDVMVTNNGLYVDTGILTLPPSLNESSVTLRQVSITSRGIEIGGGTVQVNLPDINVGDGSKVRFSKMSLTLDITAGVYTYSIDATLNIRLPQNIQDIVVHAQIDNDGNFHGTISEIELVLGTAAVGMQNVYFDANGLKADVALLRFSSKQVELFNVVINDDGLVFDGGAVRFVLPDITVSGFTVTDVSLGFEMTYDRQYKVVMQGTMDIAVGDVGAMATVRLEIDKNGKQKGSIEDFGVSIAGLSLWVIDGKFQRDKIVAAEAGLQTPAAFGGLEVAVYNIRVSKDDIKIGGGRFALPEIKSGDTSLGSLWGELREDGEGYNIKAGGKFNAPFGGKNCMLWVTVLLYYGPNGAPVVEFTSVDALPQSITANSSNLDLREVCVGLEGCVIPIGATGLFLYEITGKLYFPVPGEAPDMEVDVVVADKSYGPSDGAVSLVRIDGDMGMEFDPWQMDFGGTLTLFSFIQTGNFSARARSNYFTAKIHFSGFDGRFTIWDDRGFHMTGRAVYSLKFPKGCIIDECLFGECLSIPPNDWNIAEIGVEFGEFKKGSGSAWGIKGWVEILGYDAGFYVDTDGDLDIGNVDKYKLLTPSSVDSIRAALAADGRLKSMSDAELEVMGDIGVQGDDIVVLQTVTAPTDVGFVLSRQGEAPTLTIIDPTGREITPEALPAGVVYNQSTLDNGSIQTLYIVNDAMVGQWQAVLHNAPVGGSYLFQSFGANPPPVIEQPSALSTGAESATASWQLTSDEITTTLDIHLNPASPTITETTATGDVVEVFYFNGAAIAEDVTTTLDGSPAQIDLDLSDVPGGEYWVWFNADDGRNPPARIYASSPIFVTHPWPDEWTSYVSVTNGFRNLDVSWQEHPNPDVDVYRIEMGTQPGLVDQVIEVGPELAWPLDNLTPGETLYLTVVAVDQDTGRESRGETITAIPDGGVFDLTVAAAGGTDIGTLFVPAGSIGIMSGSADVTVTAGQTKTVDLKLTSTVDPYPAAVALYTEDVPDGVYVTFVTNSELLTPTVAGTALPVEISVAPSMIGGVYQFTVRAVGEGMQDEVLLNLTVEEPMVTVSATPAEVSLATNGDTAVFNLNAVSQFGASNTVELDLVHVPAGLEYSLSPQFIGPGQSATLSLTDTVRLANGVYPMLVRSEAGLQQQTIPITLTVQKPAFSLNPSLNSVAMLVEETAVFAIPVDGENLTGPVAFSLDGTSSIVPDGVAGFGASPTKAPKATLDVYAPGTAYLILETAETTPPGRYQFKVVATAAGQTRTETFVVTVLSDATTADLGLRQTATPQLVAGGGLVTYTMTVLNYGPLTAENVVLTDTLPLSVSFVSATPGRGVCQANGGDVSCDLYDLRRGAGVDVTVVGRLASTLSSNVALENVAGVTADQPDDVPVNNSSRATVTSQNQADLAISLAALPSPVVAGDSLRYAAMVWNTGPSDATDVTFNLDLPDGVSLVNASPGQGSCGTSVDGGVVICTLGDLPADGQTVINLNAQVNSAVRSTLTAVANVDSAVVDPFPTNNSYSIDTGVDIDVNLEIAHQIVAPAEPVAGEELTYQLIIRNTGRSNAVNVAVSDTLPEQFKRVTSLMADQGSCSILGRLVACQLGVVKAGAETTVAIRGLIDPAARTALFNVGAVEGIDTEAVVSDNQTYVETALTARVDLGLTLSGGDVGSYQYVVDNAGPSEARGVVVTGTLSAGLNITSLIPSQGTCQQNGQDFTCQIGTLSPLGRAVVNVTAERVGVLKGTAVGAVFGTETEVEAANNSADLTVWLPSWQMTTLYLPLIFSGASISAPAMSLSGIAGPHQLYLPLIVQDEK